MDKAPAIGIDLGTSYSCVGVFQNGSVEIIPNQNGDRMIPSYVAFTNTERLIGHAAKNHAATINPKNIIFDTKRLMGKRFDKLADQVRYLPFDIMDEASKPKIRVERGGEEVTFHPEEISAMVVRELKEMAEAYLKKTVTEAVISVPAHFNDSQRQATLDAGTIAGLNVIGLINEPSAASLAYGLYRKDEDERQVLVFNLGASSLDVSIVKIKDGIFKVKSTAGDPNLGGECFDDKMVDYFVNDFKTKYGKDLSTNKNALLRLKVACERAKRSLSSFDQATIEIDSLFEGIDLYTCITRPKFVAMNAHSFNRLLDCVKKSIDNAKTVKSQIDDIILVGGSTRIPKIRQLLLDFFESKNLTERVDVDKAVAYGAAIQAAIKQGGQSGYAEQLIADTLLIEVLSWPLRVTTSQRNVSIAKNTTIPLTETFSISLGKNTNEVIRVYEGEKVMDVDNNLVGNFDLRNTSSGLFSIDAHLDIDTNGILDVRATESVKKEKLTVSSEKHGLSQDEIEHLIEKAERNRTGGMECKTTTAAKNSLRSYCLNTMKTVELMKPKEQIPKSVREWILFTCDQAINPYLDLTKKDFEFKQKKLASILDPLIRSLQEAPNDSSSVYNGPRSRPVYADPWVREARRDTYHHRSVPVKNTPYSNPSSSRLRYPSSATRGFRRPTVPQNPPREVSTPPLDEWEAEW